MNLKERFQNHVESVDSVIFVMSTAMFQKEYPEESPPDDGKFFWDFEQKIMVLIDDLLPAEQVVIKARETSPDTD